MEFMSSGYMAGMFQRPPVAIEQQLAEAGVEPEMILNGVRHYNGAAAVDALRDAEQLAEAN